MKRVRQSVCWAFLTARVGEVGDKVGAGLRALLPGGLAGASPPGFTEWAVVDGVEAELDVEALHDRHRFGKVAGRG
jgi:hypothetical protein